MRPAALLQEIRKMRFLEAYEGWNYDRLSQEEAARILGVSDRTFRRYVERYAEGGVDGLLDRRLVQISHRRAPTDEVLAVVERYRRLHEGWNVKHFHAWYRREGGVRSYTWVKSRLQEAGCVVRASGRGKHRKKRERAPIEGMMIHQDGSTHAWVPGKRWDLILTMDDATSTHYSLFFVEEEGTVSSLQGMHDVIGQKGLPCSLYSDRGSHYWLTPLAGGPVDRNNPTQFGCAMKRLGIEMIPAYSPEARGRCERAFATHQGRLPNELALHGITEIEAANRYLREQYLPAHNAEFTVVPREPGSAFVPFAGDLDDYLCETAQRTVGNDNCVQFEGLSLQLPPSPLRAHYVRAKVKVLRHLDGTLSVLHGPRRLARYGDDGVLLPEESLKRVA